MEFSYINVCVNDYILKIDSQRPWLLWPVGWAVVPYTKSLQVSFLVRAHT